MYLAIYFEFLRQTEQALGRSYRVVSEGHTADADVHYTATRFAEQCARHAEALAPVLSRYVPASEPEPDRLHVRALETHRTGPLGLLRDLQDLYQLAGLVEITWTLVGQAAHGARDRELIELAEHCGPATSAQLGWLRMHLKAAAPQTLLVAR